MEKENNFKEEKPLEIKRGVQMAFTRWNRVLLGFAGGILVMGGVWWFTASLIPNSKLLSLIPIILGILSIFYGRYG